MLELIAQGAQATERNRYQLTFGAVVELGRTGEFSVPWDGAISRHHATLQIESGHVRVQRFPAARNPVFFRGRAVDDFLLAAGEQFVIGSTTFQLRSADARATLDIPPPSAEQVFAQETLNQIRFVDAEKRIAVLGQLPALISSAANEGDLRARIVNVLLAGIDSADVAAVVEAPADGPVTVLYWDRRRLAEYPFQPSERLIRRAVEEDQSILHVWSSHRADSSVTLDPHHQWAIAVPVGGESSQGWTLYVAGQHRPASGTGVGPASPDKQGDAKFAELVASMLANLRQLQVLERHAASLRPFFSPIVLQAFSGQDPRQVLAPRECDITVMFCDLRGFSRTSERMAGDLLGLLQHVSQALSIVTRNLLAWGGVVGDFHGDATMGFWGWPLADPDAVYKACRAALSIQQDFQSLRTPDSAEALTIGVGIAAGRAVAGQIGSDDQVKVTAIGPVVNLAARLESLTRAFRVPILIDAASISTLEKAEEEFRIRPLGAVRPVGLDNAVSIAEVVASGDGQKPEAWEQDLAKGLEAFASGDWLQAREFFGRAQPHSGPAAYFSKYLAANATPPTSWDGVLPLDRK